MKKTAAIIALLLLLSTCAGCGAERVSVDISDGGSLTRSESGSPADTKEQAAEDVPSEESAYEEPVEDFEGGDYSGKADENGKDSDGMQIPEVGTEETLFIGYGSLPDVGLVKMAAVLSEDKQSIHGLTMFLTDFGETVGGVDVPFLSMQNSTSNSYSLPLQEEPFAASTLKEVRIEGNRIYVRVDYVFNNIDISGTGKGDQLIPLGEVEFRLKKAEP